MSRLASCPPRTCTDILRGLSALTCLSVSFLFGSPSLHCSGHYLSGLTHHLSNTITGNVLEDIFVDKCSYNESLIVVVLKAKSVFLLITLLRYVQARWRMELSLKETV